MTWVPTDLLIPRVGTFPPAATGAKHSLKLRRRVAVLEMQSWMAKMSLVH